MLLQALICYYLFLTRKFTYTNQCSNKNQRTGLCGRKWEWDDLREQHWNMYITICEIDRQSTFDAWDRVLRAGALWWPWGMGWGGRWEGVQDGGHMYTRGCVHPLLSLCIPWFFNKNAKIIWWKIVFSTNGVGKIKYSHAKTRMN